MTIKKIHRWVGLAIAVYLAFQSVTGLLLLYRVELQNLLGESRPHLSNVQPSVSIQSVLQSIRFAYPTAVVERIDFPDSSGGTYIARLAANEAMSTDRISIDPVSGSVEPAPAEIAFFSDIVELHHELAIGTSGKYIVGTLGLLLLASSLSGAWIWWPGIKRVRRSLKIVIKGGGVRAYFSLHRTVGVIVLVFVLITSSTGLLMAFGEILRPVFGVSFAPQPVATLTQSRTVVIDSVDEMLSSARDAVPNSGIRDLRFQNSPNRVSRVLLYRDGKRDWRRGPYQQAWVDPASGQLSGILDSRNLSAGQSLFLWLFPIHTSLGLGKVGEFTVAIGGLGIVFLCVTGPMLWWKRRRPRAKDI